MTVCFDPNDWKDLPPMALDSLWAFNKHGDEVPFDIGPPIGEGTFVPAIPYYLMARYTKPGWLVYDPMCGMATTARVADLMPDGKRAWICADIVNRLPKDDPYHAGITIADARRLSTANESVDMVIWHPPYHNIIRFTDPPHPYDLSHMDTLDFWDSMEECLANLVYTLKASRIMAVVLGDIYKNSTVEPLAAQMIALIAKLYGEKMQLKGIVVKDIQGNRQGQAGLWRRRAASGDFFRFCHEYILVYKKEG
jgi:DNA modification methylase